MCGARGHRNGKTRTSLSTTTMPRITGPLKFRSFWPRTTWQWSPILTRSGPLWLFLFPKLKLRIKGRRINTIEEIQEVAAGTWHNCKKGLPWMLPSMAETPGPLYSFKRGVLWSWWRNFTSKVSKLLFTSTVLELLDTSLYKYVSLIFYHLHFTSSSYYWKHIKEHVFKLFYEGFWISGNAVSLFNPDS